MIDAQFRFNQCNSFREEYISVFSPYGSVLILLWWQPSWISDRHKKQDLPMISLGSLVSTVQEVSEKKRFENP